MSAIPATKLYTLLVPKLGKEETEGLIGFVENRKDSDLENKTKTLATKEDVFLLKEDIASLRLDTKQEITTLRLEFAEFRLETKQEFAAVRAEFAADRAETKQEFAAVRAEFAAHRAETKQECAAVRAEFAADRAETKQEFATDRSETKKEFAAVRAESKEDFALIRESIAKLEGRIEAKLENRLGDTKFEILKWMFIFWASQLLAIFSFIMLFIKK